MKVFLICRALPDLRVCARSMNGKRGGGRTGGMLWPCTCPQEDSTKKTEYTNRVGYSWEIKTIRWKHSQTGYILCPGRAGSYSSILLSPHMPSSPSPPATPSPSQSPATLRGGSRTTSLSRPTPGLPHMVTAKHHTDTSLLLSAGTVTVETEEKRKERE